MPDNSNGRTSCLNAARFAQLAYADYQFDSNGNLELTPGQSKIDQYIDSMKGINNDNNTKDYYVYAQYNDVSSGFSATVFVDSTTSQRVVAIRGTDLSDSGDLSADKYLARDEVPVDQFCSLVRLMNALQNGEDPVIIVGHSLGGALAQMAAAIDPGNVKEVVTLAAPGAKDLYNFWDEVQQDENGDI